jgi:D-alanyl-D-alanine carboxypeptidase (penicillin-binding protein 5/6)
MFRLSLTAGAIVIVFLQTFMVSAETKILIPAAPMVSAKSYILQDFDSGRILAEKNADKKMAPASLTKIMAVYAIFHELKNGSVTLDEQVTISKKAWRTPGSRMFVEVNKQISVKDLLKGVIIQSGNDASVALAEHIAGDETTFAQIMNQQAKRLNMANTHFTNSMGLPDEQHYTTARDLAVLTRALISEFPEYYQWFAEKEFTYNSITQKNRNTLLWRDETVDGVKTGHTEEAGYCLVASAKREGMRLISAVMGTTSTSTRSNENQSLLNYGFRFFKTHKLYQSQVVLSEPRIWKGESENLKLGLAKDLYVTIPRRHYKDLKASMEIDAKITAPATEGKTFGTVNVSLAGEKIISEPLVALETVNQGSLFDRLYDDALLWIQ